MTSKYEEFEAVSQIDEQMYLGTMRDARDIEWLKSASITHVLSILNIDVYGDTESKLPQCPDNIRHLQIYVDDDGWLIEGHKIVTKDGPDYRFRNRLDDCFNFLYDVYNDNKQRVLIHCYHGVNRSVCMVVAWKMLIYDLTFDEALQQVKCKRKFVLPYIGMRKEVEKYFEEL